MSLHWLKVRYRCIFKLLVIVHNCLHGAAPVEIMALIQHGDSIRTMNLRETNYSNKFGVRAFSHIGPKMWNLLPKSIRDIINISDFKKALKTFLMTRGDQYCYWLCRKWSLFLVSSIGYIIYLCDLCEKLLHDWAVVHLLMDYRSSAKTNVLLFILLNFFTGW